MSQAGLRDGDGTAAVSSTKRNAVIEFPDKASGQQSWNDYWTVRSLSEKLCEPLETEDFVIQSMPDASPAKWHLAHTTWFFEQFVLLPHLPGYRSIHPQYNYLFNSYYNTVGPQHCRPQRGLLSRPTVEQVFAYRRQVDGQINVLIQRAEEDRLQVLRPLLTLGLNHEQQHQELLLTDLKHAFSVNPLLPAYAKREIVPNSKAAPVQWVRFEGGVHDIGFAGTGFCFDNETPRHRVYLDSFTLASRPVTNGELLSFVEDGGYRTAQLWLSMGWAIVQEQRWRHPLYWYRDGDQWMQFTLNGALPLEKDEPVCHVSYFEADAFARWWGSRLPTEAEWEVGEKSARVAGNFMESEHYHPRTLQRENANAAEVAHRRRAGTGTMSPMAQCYGDVWEWTASPYAPYPGYKPLPGSLGEYNGKFMCNQFVLRGGSCTTPRSHIRPTYRNFFPPDARWQFSGIRLAKDA